MFQSYTQEHLHVHGILKYGNRKLWSLSKNDFHFSHTFLQSRQEMHAKYGSRIMTDTREIPRQHCHWRMSSIDKQVPTVINFCVKLFSFIGAVILEVYVQSWYTLLGCEVASIMYFSLREKGVQYG